MRLVLVVADQQNSQHCSLDVVDVVVIVAVVVAADGSAAVVDGAGCFCCYHRYKHHYRRQWTGQDGHQCKIIETVSNAIAACQQTDKPCVAWLSD
jgi:hypothetical protein